MGARLYGPREYLENRRHIMKTAPINLPPPAAASRRDFIRSCALGAAALASGPILGCASAAASRAGSGSGPASRMLRLDRDWLFGGKFDPAAQAPGFDDAAFAALPCLTVWPSSPGKNWSRQSWADVWIYRRHFDLPFDLKGLRVFLDFEGVMTGAAPMLNGQALPPMRAATFPSRTRSRTASSRADNVLAAGRGWPVATGAPEGSPRGRQRWTISSRRHPPARQLARRAARVHPRRVRQAGKGARPRPAPGGRLLH